MSEKSVQFPDYQSENPKEDFQRFEDTMRLILQAKNIKGADQVVSEASCEDSSTSDPEIMELFTALNIETPEKRAAFAPLAPYMQDVTRKAAYEVRLANTSESP